MPSKTVALLFALSTAGWSSMPKAQTTDLSLAQANNCLACHQVDRKRVGPAFTAIAQRFAGQPGAQDYLANTIRSGGRGRWGAVPMPAQLQVSVPDAQALAGWILSLSKAPVNP